MFETCQVQLAKVYEQKRSFTNGYYSRKFDGKRMYYLYDEAYSRDNKFCRPAPIEHITKAITNCKDLKDFVVDGEVLYFENGFEENFKKAISLTSRIARGTECDNLKYVIFDIIPADEFLDGETDIPFKDEYELLKELLDAKEIPGRVDLLATKLPNIYIARQTTDLFEMLNHPQHKDWEGLMYRNGDAPYECKRSGNLLKIKKWQDCECQVIGLKEGIGKHEGRLGALLVNYKNHVVAVGSGFNDQERELLWDNLNNNTPLRAAMQKGELYIKVKYFEESCDATGAISLRFPTYLCFRDDLGEFLIE